jgi:hypothetical protein
LSAMSETGMTTTSGFMSTTVALPGCAFWCCVIALLFKK